MKPRTGAALPVAMVALTLTTGLVEAVSFLALAPLFTATQTGNPDRPRRGPGAGRLSTRPCSGYVPHRTYRGSELPELDKIRKCVEAVGSTFAKSPGRRGKR